MEILKVFLVYGIFALSAIGFKGVLESSLAKKSKVVDTWKNEVEFRRTSKRPENMSVEEWVIPPMDKLAAAEKSYMQLNKNSDRYLVAYSVAGIVAGFLILQSFA